MPLMAVMIQPRVSLSSAMFAPEAWRKAALFLQGRLGIGICEVQRVCGDSKSRWRGG